MTNRYDNSFSDDNVYGHVLALLAAHAASGGIHLDIGCGFGRIAEPLRDRLRLEYVGIDADSDGLGSLGERGFEAHHHVFGDATGDYEFLTQLIGHRTVASISAIDCLEHVSDADSLLSVLARIAEKHRAALVLSVPNVTHRDVGFKLLFGRWDYTSAGLLDRTHLRFFSEGHLTKLTRQFGWFQVASYDVEMESSDQRFPADHPGFAEESLLRRFLTGVREQADRVGRVNQFVRAYVLGPVKDDADPGESERPFLSIVTRTQGRRPETLRDVFLSLSAQTCLDFEVLVIGHKLPDQQRLIVEQLIEDVPSWLRPKIRLIKVDHGTRTTPLNVGFKAARGRYISILDDDDLVFAHWVQTFKELAARYPGRLLRAVEARQEYDVVHPFGAPAPRARSGMKRDYPSDFDVLRHLKLNETPTASVSFPAAAFHEIGIQFDETLTTTEDWDYLMRVALVCGVGCSDEITSIYRWWENQECSRTEHSSGEWRTNLQRIWDKFDASPLLLPPGSAAKIRDLLDELELLRRQHSRPHNRGSLYAGELQAQRDRELRLLLGSGSWRITAPIRAVARLLGKDVTDIPPADHVPREEVEGVIRAIRDSTSWRVSAPLRWIKDSF